MYQAPLCKNDRCSKLVPPSKNPGVARQFCEPRCRRRYYARKQYEQLSGSGAQGMVLHDGVAWFNRTISVSAKKARIRLDQHNADCPFSTSGGACPARWDTYNRKKLCLIRAVLDEDWGQLMAAEAGRGFERELTTVDGRWVSDTPTSDLVQEARGKFTMTEEEKAAFIEAGAATPS